VQIGAVKMAEYADALNKVSRIEFDKHFCAKEKSAALSIYQQTIDAIKLYAGSSEITLDHFEKG